MQSLACTLMIAIALAPQALTAPAPPGTKPPAEAPVRSTSPVADGLRAMHQRFSGILIAAAEAMPADKYNYRPTPAQMSFAQIQVHLANEGNDILCGNTAGLAVPQRAAVDSTATKEQLVARLKETFQFCGPAFSGLDDSKLGPPNRVVRIDLPAATAVLITVADWSD